MTFYRLWSGKILDTDQNIARYFREDVDYLVNVARDLGIDTSRVEELADEAEKALRQDNDPSDEAKKLIAAVFIGDAEWNEPLEEWLPGIYQKLLEFSDSKVHRVWTDIAREKGDLSGLSFPDYSTPATVDAEIENTGSFVTSGIVALSVLHLEWWAYVADQMGLEVEEELVDRAREESLAHFTGEKDLSNEIRDFQASLFKNDSDWLENVMTNYGFRSHTLEGLRKEIDTVVEELSTT